MIVATHVRQFLLENLKRHEAFFRRSGPGAPLIMAEYPDEEFRRDYQYGTRLSETYLSEHAYELGVKAVRNALVMTRLEQKTGGLRCPGVFHNWGTGLTTALFTGGDVIFEQGTTYTSGPILQRPEDYASLRFDPDNRWVNYAVEFWRGVASQDLEGIVVASHAYRSPLDLALDMRGQDLFTDLYDAPDAVDGLLRFCTESILSLQRVLEDRVPMLRSQPGGVWGVAVKPRLIFVNGDPGDLIAAPMAEQFDYPWIVMLCEQAGAVYYHHHSIGVSRSARVCRVPGLAVQQVLQDSNGPRLEESIGDELIEASLDTPVHLGMNLAQCKSPEAIVDRLCRGRFILEAFAPTCERARQLVQTVESHG
ncbi:MAG: hypothetical protein WD042_16990 [Phycisphaeraceae bacterium]